ncbi:MAG: YgfZ/GcvT domain-containing protein [Aureliella sp.]
MRIIPIDEATILRLTGDDSVSVLNNLCTNDLTRLATGDSCEAFITNLKGWVVGHVVALRTGNGMDLFGLGSFGEAAIAHMDRYVIREDVQFEDLSREHRILLAEATIPASLSGSVRELGISIGDWRLCTTDTYGASTMESESEVEVLSDAFDSVRIQAFWPRLGHEIGEKTLPQELMRDDVAISFTKGCYLGQETIARLDARGQLQKQLCLLAAQNTEKLPSGEIQNESGKVVGQVTSACTSDASSFALAFIKRGNNEPGTKLTISGAEFTVSATA